MNLQFLVSLTVEASGVTLAAVLKLAPLSGLQLTRLLLVALALPLTCIIPPALIFLLQSTWKES